MAKIQSPSIPNEVKEQIQAIVAAYNAAHGMEYVADCKKKYCYISKLSQRVFPITKLNALLAAKQLAQPPKIERFWQG